MGIDIRNDLCTLYVLVNKPHPAREQLISMKVINVSSGQQEALARHRSAGERLAENTNYATTEQIAWMGKCAALVQMIDPNVRQRGYGILSQLFWSLNRALEDFRTGERHGSFSDRVAEQFLSAVSTLDVLITTINIAPDSVITGQDDDAPGINPYFFDVRAEQQSNQVFVLMPFTEDWSDRIWQSHQSSVNDISTNT